jgi:protein TonB
VRPRVQPKPNRAYSYALIAASVLLVAGVGAAADYFFVHQEQGAVVARAEEPAAPAAAEQPQPVATEPAAEVTAPKEIPPEPPAPAPVRAAAPAPKDPAAAKPKPTPTAKPSRATAAKPAPKPAAPREIPRPAPALSAAAPAPATPPPAREVVATAPASVEKAAAVGPFFETKDVNEQPKVAARVEPRLPAELRAKNVHEIVIVRALVSQSGHPSRVSVLRKSKAGPQLDDVVVAAVNQWTFSPARKKGEPVSCWFNFGVQVGSAD